MPRPGDQFLRRRPPFVSPDEYHRFSTVGGEAEPAAPAEAIVVRTLIRTMKDIHSEDTDRISGFLPFWKSQEACRTRQLPGPQGGRGITDHQDMQGDLSQFFIIAIKTHDTIGGWFRLFTGGCKHVDSFVIGGWFSFLTLFYLALKKGDIYAEAIKAGAKGLPFLKVLDDGDVDGVPAFVSSLRPEGKEQLLWLCSAKAGDLILFAVGHHTVVNKILDRVGLFTAHQLGMIDQAEEKFGYLLECLDMGAPPHGKQSGIAFGLDWLVMLMSGASSIRDVIAFPKTTTAQCALTKTPSEVDPQQLAELSLSTRFLL